jgi:hypothetical protein
LPRPILKQVAGWSEMRIAAAAMLYFAVVFGVGFLLGPIRVLWLEPKLGPTGASLCEAPFLLLTMVIAARRLPDFDVREASGLLLQFEVVQALHMAEWDRLRNELAL